jgi:Cdc6-like AAA superfamily ATPase
MDIEARIKRRQRRDGEPRLIQDYEALAPVTHTDEPADRGPVLEQLLDHLDPVFDGALPANGYVYGPLGSGKSAVVNALFTHLDRLPSESQAVIHTTKRAQAAVSPSFVYLDARRASTEFAFYHALLDAISEEPVPEHGVGTETLRTRLRKQLQHVETGTVVAIDHIGEPQSLGAEDMLELFGELPETVRWLAIGRDPPADCGFEEHVGSAIEFEEYQRQMLVDVLMTRASDGLAQGALNHSHARRIADWADGNAHNALAALFVAAIHADRAGRNRLGDNDVETAIDEIPEPCVALGSVLALPANRQAVLRELVDLNEADRGSVTATTEAIADSTAVDLSPGTVKRFLYEMAESGIVERIQAKSTSGQGRPPSRVEPRFPPTAFRQLYDLRP